MEIKKPNLLEYLNLHAYLKDLYKFRKKTEPSFSYELWAQELDFKNRSYLRQIIIGRRSLTIETAKQMAVRLNLQGIEKEYFEVLARASRARSEQQKEQCNRELLSFIKTEYLQQEVQNYREFVSNTLYPQLQTLLSFKDIGTSPEELAGLLRRSSEEIHQALQTLSKMQMAQQEGTQWKSLVRSFKVSDDLGESALLEHHKKSLSEAAGATVLPKEQRRYLSLLLPLSGEDFQVLLDEFHLFKKNMIRKFGVDSLRGRRLYQMNFNIHSISEESQDQKFYSESHPEASRSR